MANTTKKRKQPSKRQQDVQNQADVERGVGRVEPTTTKGKIKTKRRRAGWGGVQVDETKIRTKGKV